MKKIKNLWSHRTGWGKMAALMLLAGTALTSCSVDDILNGSEETYQILDKCSGTLDVYEKYAAQACRFEVEPNNDEKVSTIEFMPDGHYVVSYIENKYQAPQQHLHIDVAGRTFAVPLSLARQQQTRSTYVAYTKTGTYTYENGAYKLVGLDWKVENGKLSLLDTYTGMERSYSVNPTEKMPANTLTARLCHRWELEEVLLKLYKENKLVFSYQLTGPEMDEECVSAVEFTPYSTFLRYEEADYAGTGTWHWTNLNEQLLYYAFNPPLWGENSLTAYFAGNHFYMTEELEAFDEEDDENSRLKAVCLYKMSVKGN